jgi:hypothetical protein
MRFAVSALAVTTLLATLTGCAGFNNSTGTVAATPIALNTLKGNVHGGQNPIAGATIQLYQSGNSAGYGQGATSLIPVTSGGYYAGGATGCVASGTQTCYNTVTTDANGNFSITGLYSCTSGTQVYIVATGGNTGSGTNTASNLMTGMGLCDNVPSIPFLQINEVTTVATVWALSPFITDASGVITIGTSTGNTAGLAEAFGDIGSLSNVTYGTAVASTTNVTVPTQEIYAIANSLAACVNSTGYSDAGMACSNLFNYTGLTSSSDTIAAAISMARNPGTNANNILALGSGKPAFATTFTTANDLTLAVTYSGNGISSPSALAIDASGNVFIANSVGNSVSEFSHGGVAATGSPFTAAGTMSTPSGLAVDAAGDIWVANSGNNTLTELTSLGTSPTYVTVNTGGLSGPNSIAFDGLGNAWVSNYSNNSVSEFTSNGTAVAGSPFMATGLASPIGVAINPH